MVGASYASVASAALDHKASTTTQTSVFMRYGSRHGLGQSSASNVSYTHRLPRPLSVSRVNGAVSASEGDIVTVVIGCFEPLLGAGLKMQLGGDSGVGVLASEVDDAMLEEVVERDRPRVVIVGETVESDVVARLKTGRSVAGVLVLAQAPSAQWGTLLLASGVSCVARSTSVVDLLAAIRSAAAGEPMLVDRAAGRVERRRRGEALTPRELEVFGHLVLGRSYAWIARKLGIAPTTARSHTVSICRKINVASKRELIGLVLPIGDPS